MKQKGLRKLVSMILAVVMVLAMSITGFAEETTGSITILSTKEDYTYNLYKIFSLTGEDSDTTDDGTYNKVAYTVNSAWVSFFFEEGALGSGYLIAKTSVTDESSYADYNTLTYNGAVYYMNITDDNIVEFAEDALDYVLTKNIAADNTENGTGDDVTVENLPLGYYLVYPYGASILNSNSNGSICSLTSTNPDSEVKIKADLPDIEKEDDIDNNSAYVGQEITYTITGTVPDTTGYDSYTYKVIDEMTEGLTFDGLSSIDVVFTDESGGTSTETKIIEGGNFEGSSITLTLSGEEKNGFTLSFDMTKYTEYVGQTITITYTATVNSRAVTVISKNSATLTYSNNQDETTTTEKETKIYSAKIVVDKHDENDDTKKLAGAKFKLYRYTNENKTEKEYYIVNSVNGSVSWGRVDEATEFTTDDNGAVTIEGLEDGTYYLVETEAPTGYNLLTEDTEIEIENSVENLEKLTDENGNESNEDEIAAALTSTASVSNNTGTTLPGTGGIGTTIFYVVGAILMFGAAVMLVTKVRIGKEK